MAGPVETEVDLAAGHLLRWLEAETAGGTAPSLSIRATRDWRVEPATDTPGLDDDDELAAHVAYGTLEIVPTDRSWCLTLEVVDGINGGAADDWPPVGIESDGPDEVSLATFAETFAIDDLEARLTLRADDTDARRRADRVIARVLADSHRRR
jgi:hypothetical protein